MKTIFAVNPRLMLAGGCACCVASLYLSIHSGKWHWFPRGGAVLGLAGFIVSVREALLYRAQRDRVVRFSGTGMEGLVRSGPFGVPVFNPNLPSFAPADPDMTVEQEAAERQRLQEAWDEAEPLGEEVEVESGDEGRAMRGTDQMTPDELSQLRTAALFGVIGTLIWAFGDLCGGLPH